MTRQIKLRAWSKTGKVMHPVWKKTDDENGEYIIMEWTGLLDKNGKEVYEGDVVKCSAGCAHEVFWREAQPFVNMGCWDLKGLVPGKYDWIGTMEEIIGNVWENPELV